MAIRCFRVQQLLRVTLLFSILLAGFPGTSAAAPQVPEVFRQLEARVVGLRFYSTETSKGAPMPTRVYNTDFIRADTHYIWWELHLDTKVKRNKPVTLFIKAIWQRPDGTEFNQSHNVTIAAKNQRPWIAAGWGYTDPKRWLPGSYSVVIHIDDVKVASGSFEVFEKLLKKQ